MTCLCSVTLEASVGKFQQLALTMAWEEKMCWNHLEVYSLKWLIGDAAYQLRPCMVLSTYTWPLVWYGFSLNMAVWELTWWLRVPKAESISPFSPCLRRHTASLLLHLLVIEGVRSQSRFKGRGYSLMGRMSKEQQPILKTTIPFFTSLLVPRIMF